MAVSRNSAKATGNSAPPRRGRQHQPAHPERSWESWFEWREQGGARPGWRDRMSRHQWLIRSTIAALCITVLLKSGVVRVTYKVARAASYLYHLYYE